MDSSIIAGMWETDESVFSTTDDLVKSGCRIASDSVPSGITRDRGVRRWFPRNMRWGLITACAVILLAAGSWMIWPDFFKSQTIPAPVQTALENASESGLFVLPGSEGVLGRSGFTRRSGFLSINDSLNSSLELLLDSYHRGDYSSDVAYWLIAGKVVIGQTDMARILIDGATKRYPKDPRLIVLDALIEYQTGYIGRSKDLLRSVLDTDPNHPAACINLAAVIILEERGGYSEAREILNRVLRVYAGEPIADRATALLTNIPD